jgi:hypothetical protein
MIDIVSFIAIAWAAPPRVPGRRADRAPPPSVVLNGKLHFLTPPTGAEACRNSTVTDCKQALTAKSGRQVVAERPTISCFECN